MTSRGIRYGITTTAVVLAVVACGPATGGQPGTGSLTPTPTSAPGPTSTSPPSTSPPSGTGTTSAPPPNAAPVTPIPGSGPAIPASRIDASGMTGQAPNQVWTQENGTVVALVVEQAGCDHVSLQLNAQSGSTVMLTVLHTIASRHGQICPMIVREVPIAVRLAAPLANRTVVLHSTTVHG